MSPRAAPPPRRRGVFRRLTRWLLSLKGSPSQIALGLAVGVFVGISPLWGVQMFLAAALATLVTANRPAAVAAVWVSNPLTAVPLYSLTYRVGHAFVPGEHRDSIQNLLTQALSPEALAWYDLPGRVRAVLAVGEEILVPLLIGGALVGTFAAVLTYVVCRPILTHWRRPRLKRKTPAA